MMLGLVAGALFGIGALMLWSLSWPESALAGTRGIVKRPKMWVRFDETLASVGFVRARTEHVVVASIVLGLFIFVTVFALTRGLVPALVAALAAAYVPGAGIRYLAAKRRTNLHLVWPEVVDLVNSAVKAGLTLPEALAQLSEKGPETLRPAFENFARDYHASGNFDTCLTRLKALLSDPVADRIVEALRVAHDVGGTDLGTLLRTLASFLREDLRVRAELSARQSWTINGAKLALFAPWGVLALMFMRPEAASAYNTPLGAFIILAGAIVSVIAYKVMLAFAKLPTDDRVLR